jgi:hypothetical protein
VSVSWSRQSPKVGEHLLLIGYTREKEELVRYWTLIEIIDVPVRHRKSDAGHHVWFKTVSGEKLREGFSGAPLLRAVDDGQFEACAMMVSAAYVKDVPSDIGVAIVLDIPVEGLK